MKLFLCLLLCLIARSTHAQLDDHVTARAMKAYQEMHHVIDQSFEQAITQSIKPGATILNITRPEGIRSFIVYASPAYINSTQQLPLLLTFHGLGDNCQSFLDETGFTGPANSDKPFLLVAPCATAGLIGNAWNSGTCCLQPTKVDDVAFTRAILQTLSQVGYGYNPKQVFSSGFSNGAMMSEILGCQLGDTLRGIASVSGVVELEPGNGDGLDKCDSLFAASNTSLAVLHVHGIKDPIVLFDGDFLLGFPGIEKDLDRWADRIGCASQSSTTWTNGTFTASVWDCTSRVGASIELVTNSVGVHEWPSTPQFDTTTAIVRWMRATVANDHSIKQSYQQSTMADE